MLSWPVVVSKNALVMKQVSLVQPVSFSNSFNDLIQTGSPANMSYLDCNLELLALKESIY
jgi:hypothetical protein